MSNGSQPVLEVEGLVKHFTIGRGVANSGRVVHAVDGVSFSIAPGKSWAWSASPAAARRRLATA